MTAAPNISARRGDGGGLFDLIRGIAALLVVANHLRSFVFASWGNAAPDTLWAPFYLLTSLGHQAVVIFFVLSGYFISRSVETGVTRPNFSTIYAINRLTRLWLVLVPALLLTAFWDALGKSISPLFYDGSLVNRFASGPVSGGAGDLWTALANLFFLQTIVAPPFGSNGPLWSLAYEFWYYALFPALYIALAPGARSWSVRLIHAALAATVIALLPLKIVLYGGIWALGYLAHRISKIPMTRSLRRPAQVALLVVCIGATLFAALSRADGLLADLLLALPFAVWMGLTAKDKGSQVIRSAGRIVSRPSYTLYLTHFPFLAFLSTAFLANVQFAPSGHTILIYLSMFGATLLQAGVLYCLFERQTVHLQMWVRHKLVDEKTDSAAEAQRANR